MRLLEPLREGGSLPLLAEATDGFKYALKLKGGGHGPKALIADFLGTEIARVIGLKVPEQVFMHVSEHFGRAESDYEVQCLLKKSVGLNLGVHFLSGALTIDPYANPIDSHLASMIVWLDAYITNIDRSIKNPNMLIWYGEPWLIDHGAAFLFHASWSDPIKASISPFQYIKDHALLRKATMLEQVDAEIKAMLTPDKIDEIVALLPDEWLMSEGCDETPEEIRGAYSIFLKNRLINSNIFVQNAIEARRVFL